MSIEGFDYKEQFIGTDDTNVYEFDFKIFDSSHLYFYLQDQFGNILDEFDGTDTTFLSGVTFDPVEGGGTVTLINNLPTSYVLTIFLANDLPAQPTEFANKSSFTLEAIEGALDYLAAAIQRIAYLAQRSIRLHDVDDIDTFDMRLPMNLYQNPSCILTVNAAGDGFAVGPTITSILSIVSAEAAAALLSEQNAAASAALASTKATAATVSAASAAASASSASGSATAAAASAVSAAASAGIAAVSGFDQAASPHAVTDGQSATNLTGEIFDSVKYSSAFIIFEIKRGTSITLGWLHLSFNGVSWDCFEGPYTGPVHGVTWSLTGTFVGQLLAALDVGAGDGSIKLKKTYFAA